MKQQMQPKVSIIIPVYNGSNYLQEAIDSALAQTYPNCEILVINDGSCDEGKTEAIALSYGDRIRYFKKENGGVASALNMGIRQMTGEYFSWLSHDDVYYPNKVKREVQAILASGDPMKLVQCEYDFYDEATGTYTPTDFSKTYTIGQLTNSVFSVLQLQIHACCALIHKSHFDRVGMFDESRPYTQDVEMWFRLFRNQKSLWVTERLYKVRVHAQSDSKHYYDAWNKENSKLYLMMMQQLSDGELAKMYGTAETALCRIIGLIRSRNGIEEAEALENRFYTCIRRSSSCESDEAFQEYLNELTGNKKKAIVLFGAGQYGVRMLYEMKHRNIAVDYFMDNNPKKEGKIVDGIMCHQLSFFREEKEKYFVIVTQRMCADALLQLKEEAFPYVTSRQALDGALLDYAPRR